MKRERRRYVKKGGFTVFEMIVSIAIITVLSGLVISNYRAYEKRLELDNLTQDIALSIRLAQSYGLNVRGADFESSYGISFSQGASGSYFIYRDTNQFEDGLFTSVGADTLETFNLNTSYSIYDVCGDLGGGVFNCFLAGDIDRMDITFNRPKPDALFNDNNDFTAYEKVVVTVENPKGVRRDITVWSTGYIETQ